MSTGSAGTMALGGGASLDALRSSAVRDPKAAIRDAAKQFEALFMQELLKSMRAGTLGDGWLDNAGSKMGTEMLDGQFATQMSGLPGGLGDLIARQLERQLGAVASTDHGGVPGSVQAPSLSAPGTQGNGAPTGAQDFVQQHLRSATAAAAETGIPAAYILGQAAHESGWGRHEIRNSDGSGSHNLFGIKAGPGWNGKVAEVTTTEYVEGQPRKVVARFRAYDSYEASFRDYANLIKNSPRYTQVVAGGSTVQGFAQGLQRAGYATDPAYADKLSRVINTTLRLQRTVA
ncbi:MAG: flagellar assembly peptidoglycan hydrolase FlgJ [Proteobacteria bacterium]|nr:flagellar assembly peptidoglycan hydrolase FlgJ [Pseudomonadota bacterium]